MVKAKRLKKGDTIMLISPAAGLAGIKALSHRADNGETALRRMGFEVTEGKNTRIAGIRAGSGKDRASDINEGIKNQKVKALIAMIGGNHVCAEILPYLDFGLIKDYPKIFMGYSDITALLLGIYAKTNLVTFYGPAVMSEFGDYPRVLPYTEKWMKKALMSNQPIGKIDQSSEWTDELLEWSKKLDLTRARKMNQSTGWKWLQNGKASGRLIGGCIQSLSFIIKNYPKYLPDFSECIFFWESAEKEVGAGHPPEEVIADLKIIKEFGILKKMNGMVIGRPYQYNEEWHKKLEKLIVEVTDDPQKPILYNVEIGHTNPILTLPIGALTVIDSIKNSFSINESGVI